MDIVPKDASSTALIVFGVSMVLAKAIDYASKRVRVPLKRAHDEHVEKMVGLLERLTNAVDKLDDKLNEVGSGVGKLLDRGGR